MICVTLLCIRSWHAPYLAIKLVWLLNNTVVFLESWPHKIFKSIVIEPLYNEQYVAFPKP